MKYTLFNHPFLHVNFCYQTLRYCTSTATATELCNYKRLAGIFALSYSSFSHMLQSAASELTKNY